MRHPSFAQRRSPPRRYLRVAVLNLLLFCGGGVMAGEVRIVNLNDGPEFAAMKADFERNHPGIVLSHVQVDGEQVLRAQQGGMRVFWLYRGQGAVLLPQGYRTQEGDGSPLPDEYRPDRLTPVLSEKLQWMKAGLPTVSAAASVPVRAILGRWKDGAMTGDFAGDLWKLEQIPRPWSGDPQVEASIESLFRSYRTLGFSTKQADSYEPIQAGDQLIACGQQEVAVRGQFTCLSMENVHRRTSHISTARRLRFLVDSAGGCNPDFDPFRRLPLTWYPNYPGEAGDGPNWVNSHVVNIPKETSPAHFHPPKLVGSQAGSPQTEMYLVLDPKAYRLSTWGRKASLLVFPNLRDLNRYQEIALKPGMFIYIPPGTGHRGLDVFVNVLTLPGFKPNNEFYIDRDIRDTPGGKAPFNQNLLDAKNFGRIEDLL